MAQRTIAPGGGNSNVAATYVELAVPTSADFIVGDASSGNFTVVANLTVRYVDFSLYTALLTINNNIQLTLGLAASTSTFSASMTYDFIGSSTTQGRIGKANIAMTFNMLGTTPIPCFINTGSAVLTAASDLYFINILQNSTLAINGSFNTYISGNFQPNISQQQFGGTQPYNMVGTGTLAGTCGLQGLVYPATLNINTLGTITITSQLGISKQAYSSSADISATFNHIAGTIVNPTLLINPNVVGAFPGKTILNLISGTTWDVYLTLAFGTNYLFNVIEFNGVADFNQFSIGNIDAPTSSQEYLVKIQGDANISCNDFTFSQGYRSISGSFLQKISIDLLLTPGQSITVNNSIDINGGTDQPGALQTPPLEIKSTTGGTQANLILNTYNQFVSRVKITDIDCSGGDTLYGQELTLSNTTNITQYTLPPASGGTSESSYVFFS